MISIDGLIPEYYTQPSRLGLSVPNLTKMKLGGAYADGVGPPALVDIVEAVARLQPTMMLLEDAHWADPTSLEELDLVIDRIRNIPLLLVLTHRPEFQPRWQTSITRAVQPSDTKRLPQ